MKRYRVKVIKVLFVSLLFVGGLTISYNYGVRETTRNIKVQLNQALKQGKIIENNKKFKDLCAKYAVI